MRRVSSWLLLITLCVGCYNAQEDMRAEKARNDAIANDLKELGLKMHAEQQAVEPESDTKPEPETKPNQRQSRNQRQRRKMHPARQRNRLNSRLPLR